ncbi:MAG: carboxypeptidase-like regulatory domain-containing protein [Bacteroidales bacterium]|jgi:hypothetical protein|nr:carboxypeptidase-like regulatory domain-containing protein [Bacteroidales bacterium]
MKKILILFISFIFIITACTKSDLRVQGFVRNNKKNPIEDVTILITKSKKTLETKTDKSGFYMFDNLPAGKWDFTVFKMGYDTISNTYSVSAGSGGNVYTKNFELTVYKPK